MTRGQRSEVGDTRTAPNGYHYTKTEEKWELTHHLIAKEHLLDGRMPDTKTERVIFVDGDRSNLAPENIQVVPKKEPPLKRRRAELEARIEELQAELDHVNAQIAEQS